MTYLVLNLSLLSSSSYIVGLFLTGLSLTTSELMRDYRDLDSVSKSYSGFLVITHS